MCLGAESRLSVETRDSLIGILVYDEDDCGGKTYENAKATSDAITEILLAIWLTKKKQADEEFRNNAEFVANYIELILIEFGKKKPKVFWMLPSLIWIMLIPSELLDNTEQVFCKNRKPDYVPIPSL